MSSTYNGNDDTKIDRVIPSTPIAVLKYGNRRTGVR